MYGSAGFGSAGFFEERTGHGEQGACRRLRLDRRSVVDAGREGAERRLQLEQRELVLRTGQLQTCYQSMAELLDLLRVYECSQARRLGRPAHHAR
jgi:hypothetical protein